MQAPIDGTFDNLDDLRIVGSASDGPIVYSSDAFSDYLDELTSSLPPELVDGFNDSANSEYLARFCKGRMLYNRAWGWCVFDGKKWTKYNDALAMQFAKYSGRSLLKIAANQATDADQKKLTAFGQKMLSRAGIENTLRLAEGDLYAEVERFDRDQDAFNCLNRTLNLRTFEEKRHDPEDLISKIAGTQYDPEAQCPQWRAFLETIVPDEDTRGFLQRAVGYSLTGDVSEQVLFFLHGGGNNGKSTFIRTILSLLGEYGRQMMPTVLLQGDRHPTEIAALVGVRFAATIEIEQGRRMAEVMVKQLTGGDRIAARSMFHDPFEFEPTFKIWMAANHKPIIHGQDLAIWRRIRLIPFTVTIPEDKRDPAMPDKLARELPGILNWAIDGYQEWKSGGLKAPEKVKAATDKYKAEMDQVGEFLEDACTLEEGAEVRSGELYSCFKSWAEGSGEKAMSQMSFSLRLEEKGFEKTADKAGKKFLGLRMAKVGEKA